VRFFVFHQDHFTLERKKNLTTHQQQEWLSWTGITTFYPNAEVLVVNISLAEKSLW
jgi:hypothetical protein